MKNFKLLFVPILALLITSCGRQMKESDMFIDSVHGAILKGDFDKIESEMVAPSIKSDPNFGANIAHVFNILKDAKVVEVDKALGYSININNGVTQVESKYKWKGENYDVTETIIVTNDEGGYKVLGLHVKRVE